MSGAAQPEEAWSLLAAYLYRLGDDFDYYLIGCADESVRTAFRMRLRESTLKENRPFEEPPSHLGLLEDPLKWLGERMAKGRGDEKPVVYLPVPDRPADVVLLHRLNEHRDNFIRELR